MKQQTKQSWQECKLEDIGSFQYGYTASTKQENTGFKFVRISDIEENGSINWKTVPFCNINSGEFEKFKLDFGDILFARIGATTGKTTFIDKKEKAVFASYLIRFTVNDEIDSKFVYYFTQSRYYWDQAFKQREGQLKKGMNANTLSQIEISIPKFKEEQTAIAKILSTTDEALEALERERLATERLKRGIMVSLIGGKNWGSVKLSEVAEILDSKRIPLSEMQRAKRKGEYPYCGANGIIDYIDDFIFDEEYILLAEDGGDYKKFGNSAYLMKGKFWVNNHAHIIKAISNKMTKDYLFYLLNYLDLQVYIVGSTRTKLNQERMKDIEIPIPYPEDTKKSLEEQKRIAEILSTIDKKLELQKARKEKIERVKKGLMDELLTGKKRVNVERILEEEK